MSYIKTADEFLSSDEKTTVRYSVYTPDIPPFAVLQICPGAFEDISEYEKNGFIDALTSEGITVCGNDPVGYGENDLDESRFPSSRGVLVNDLHTLCGIMKKTYRSLPYVLFGNGIGGCAVLSYAVLYNDVDGAAVCGAPCDPGVFGAAKAVSGLIFSLRGGQYRSKLLRKLVLSKMNEKFHTENDELSFLTSDIAARSDFRSDTVPAAAYYREVFGAVSDIADETWAGKVPLSLPVFLASGTLDPVTCFGEGTKDVFTRLEDAELNELRIKLYDGCRHELLREPKSADLIADVTEWIKEVADGVVACRSYGAFGFGAL